METGNFIMTGLKRGNVRLIPHQREWEETARETISILKDLLGREAIDIQHVGSTAIREIKAKPIIDIVVGVHELEDILPYIEILEYHGFLFRGEVVQGQYLFIREAHDDIRTHHIHITVWASSAWNNYINFRDYLNFHPQKAKEYEKYKEELALSFPDDRKSYTSGKEEIIQRLLEEARIWRKQERQ